MGTQFRVLDTVTCLDKSVEYHCQCVNCGEKFVHTLGRLDLVNQNANGIQHTCKSEEPLVMSEPTKNIERWAEERGFFKEGGPTVLQQHKVLMEEMLELRDELRSDPATYSAKLELGDCVVVLTIMAELMGTSIEECLELAYDKIKDRKGEWRNGKWTKESDL